MLDGVSKDYYGLERTKLCHNVRVTVCVCERVLIGSGRNFHIIPSLLRVIGVTLWRNSTQNITNAFVCGIL